MFWIRKIECWCTPRGLQYCGRSYTGSAGLHSAYTCRRRRWPLQMAGNWSGSPFVASILRYHSIQVHSIGVVSWINYMYIDVLSSCAQKVWINLDVEHNWTTSLDESWASRRFKHNIDYESSIVEVGHNSTIWVSNIIEYIWATAFCWYEPHSLNMNNIIFLSSRFFVPLFLNKLCVNVTNNPIQQYAVPGAISRVKFTRAWFRLECQLTPE